LGSLGQWDKQAADMTMAIRYDPGVPDFWWHRRHAYEQLSQTGKARSDFQKFVDLTQGDPNYEGWRTEVQE
jgi:regulator of sirC expression with transglutaminase-like and TPR domain